MKGKQEDGWCHCELQQVLKIHTYDSFRTNKNPIAISSVEVISMTNANWCILWIHSCYSNTTCQLLFPYFGCFFVRWTTNRVQVKAPNVWVYLSFYLPSPLSHIATQIFWELNISGETGQLCRAEAGSLGTSKCRGRRESFKLKRSL